MKNLKIEIDLGKLLIHLIFISTIIVLDSRISLLKSDIILMSEFYFTFQSAIPEL